jgi:hypothetical protein
MLLPLSLPRLAEEWAQLYAYPGFQYWGLDLERALTCRLLVIVK